MKKYDVGVMGFWYSCNYGSILTYFGLNHILREYGYSVLMIDKPVLFKNDIEYRDTHSRLFAKENYDISNIYEIKDLVKLNDICDTFILGSDQLWNYGLAKPFGYAMFLDFVNDDKKKLACATSFGHDTFGGPDGYKKIVYEYLSKFDGISVRENSGVDILKNDFDLDAKLIADPIVMCGKEAFEELVHKSTLNLKNENYIIAYILDYSKEKEEYLCKISSNFNKKVYVIVDGLPWRFEENKNKYTKVEVLNKITACDFLYAISNAFFVVTDSYHGMCLSILYNKQFLCFGNNKRGNTRFLSLLEKLELKNRLFTGEKLYSDIINFPIDYFKVNEKLNAFTDYSKKWLSDKLSTTKSGYSNDNTCLSLERSKCTGCGTCAAVCAKKAIKIEPDDEGFLKPSIDSRLCNDCGLCKKRCPVLNFTKVNNPDPDCYAVMAQDNIREISSSGGMFTLLANYILERNGVVCGAAYNDDHSVSHLIINSEKDLFKLRGSKYIQSSSWECYQQIRNYLLDSKWVLFVGTPCQVSGLKSFLHKNYEHLVTVDLLCHGISSYKVFKKYITDLFGNKEIDSLEFKAKKPWGWHAGMNIKFKDDSAYSKICDIDPYFASYLSGLSKSSSCALCKANSLPRQGEFTIGDFWKVTAFDKNLNDGLGTSMVLVNNEKAKRIFEEIKKLSITKLVKQVPIKFAINGNNIIVRPYKLNKNRNLFFKYLSDFDIGTLYDYCKNSSLLGCLRNYDDNVNKYSKNFDLYILAYLTAKYYKGRKIVTWIKNDNFNKILFDKYGIKVHLNVTLNKNLVNQNTMTLDFLRGKSSEYYLVSLDRGYDNKIYSTLSSYGFEEHQDFLFRFFKPIVIENLNLSNGYYQDQYGNTIEGKSGVISKVIIRGYNNHVSIGSNVSFDKDTVFELQGNSFIKIEDDSKFFGKTLFDMKFCSGFKRLYIGSSCVFNNGSMFRLFSNASVILKDHITSSSSFGLHCVEGKNILIGRDCMFSYENEIWSGDGHCIFDVSTSSLLNYNITKANRDRDCLIIGDHVWVGKQAFLLGNTSIGSGSIVGARAVVKGHYPNNCIIAGNPSSLIKRDKAWSRSGVHTTTIDKCGLEYVKLTNNCMPELSFKKVLIIGGTGKIASFLIPLLLENGNYVSTLSRHNIEPNDNIEKHFIVDSDNLPNMLKAFKNEYFDVVFDLIAYSALHVNNVLSSIKCNKYIQISSAAVYNKFKLMLDETEFNPLNFDCNLNDISSVYYEGKRMAETVACKYFNSVNSTIVRLPPVTQTERLYYYCDHIFNKKPMKVDNINNIMTFVDRTDIAKFLVWIAGQKFNGIYNFASDGFVTTKMLVDYISNKLDIKPLFSQYGDVVPFNTGSYTLNLEKVKQKGFICPVLNNWFWKSLDQYISRVSNA